MNKTSTRRRGGRVKGQWQEGLSGQVLREWRAKHGISRKVLAKSIGVSSTAVQNWEQDGVPLQKKQDELSAIMSGNLSMVMEKKRGVLIDEVRVPTGMHVMVEKVSEAMIEGMKIEAVGRIVAGMIGHAKPGTVLDLDSMVARAKAALAK